MTYIKEVGIKNLDAFFRVRTSNPETLFDSKLIFDNAPLFWDDVQVSGAASSTYSQNTASVALGVSASTAGRRVRQTFQRFNYQSGKSQEILQTGVLDKSGGGTGITRRMGLYDDNNGIFLEDAAGTYNLVIRSYTGGSASDANKVAQANWNVDGMNTGLNALNPSGLTVDFSKSHILFIDYEWLGVGSVFIGLVINRRLYPLHIFHNSNINNTVYMSTPNLPMRFEIINDGTGAASTMDCICGTVISEGGLQKNGVLRHKDSATLTGLSTGTKYAVVGVRLKSPYSATVLMENVSLLCTTLNDFAHWELLFNPTVAGTFTYSDMTNSTVQTATGTNANTVTGGYELGGGFFSTNSPPAAAIENALKLGSTIAGVPDTIVLCVTPVTNNISVLGSMTWREL